MAAVAIAGAAAPRVHREPSWPWMLLALAFGTLVAGAMTPRDLSLGEALPTWHTDPNPLSFELMRALTAAALLASAVTATRTLVLRGLPRAGLAVWCGYAAFVLAALVLPCFLGRVPGVDSRVLYPPLVFTGLYLGRPIPAKRFAWLCRVAMGAFVYAGLAAAVVQPAHAIAASYEGLIPGLDIRLYGVGGGAISLGVHASLLVALELVAPSRSSWRWINLAAGALALLLTQAKTSWLFLLGVVAVLGLHRLRGGLGALRFGRGGSARAAGLLAAAGAVAILGVAAYRGASGVDVRALPTGESLTHLTGRTFIWQTSLRTWLEDPVFGYGLGLWEGEYRERHAAFVPHAHNQFIHTLASAGLVGLAGLLAYLASAIRSALRAARSDPVPILLLAAVLAQTTSNVPLLGQYLVEPLVLVHLLLFAALVNSEKLRAAASRPERAVVSGAAPSATPPPSRP